MNAARQVRVVHQAVPRIAIGPVTLAVHACTPVLAFAGIVPIAGRT
jgi:hypothetical protein